MLNKIYLFSFVFIYMLTKISSCLYYNVDIVNIVNNVYYWMQYLNNINTKLPVLFFSLLIIMIMFLLWLFCDTFDNMQMSIVDWSKYLKNKYVDMNAYRDLDPYLLFYTLYCFYCIWLNVLKKDDYSTMYNEFNLIIILFLLLFVSSYMHSYLNEYKISQAYMDPEADYIYLLHLVVFCIYSVCIILVWLWIAMYIVIILLFIF